MEEALLVQKHKTLVKARLRKTYKTDVGQGETCQSDREHEIIEKGTIRIKIACIT